LIALEEVKKKKEDGKRSNASKYQKNRPTRDKKIVTTSSDTNMFNTPIEECTLLASIPESLSVTYVGLGFEGEVIVVGDYYYNHNMRAIEKRKTKRKGEKDDTSHETFERNIKWKARPNPKDNVIQATLSLNSFVDVNIVLVYEFTGALDTTKSRVTELETTLDTIKDTMAHESRKEALET
jgi:hypothetical protein